MSIQTDFIPGYDFSALSTSSAANIYNAIKNLEPLPNIGGVIYQTGAPDVANNPRFTRYIRLNPTTNPPTLEVYNGSTYVSAPLGVDAVSTTSIQALAVTVAKLSATGASALQQLRVKADLSGLEFFTFTLSNGQVALANLATVGEVTGAPSAGMVPMYGNNGSGSSDNAIKWRTPDVNALLINGGLALAKLATGTVGKILQTDGTTANWVELTGLLVSDNSIPISKLKLAEATAYQGLRKKGDNTGFEYAIDNLLFRSSAGLPPAAGAVTTYPHLLGGVPDAFDWFAECSATFAGYAVGDRIPLQDIRRSNGSAQPVYMTSADATNIIVVAASVSDSVHILNKATGVIDSTLTTNTIGTKFNFRCVASRFNRS